MRNSLRLLVLFLALSTVLLSHLLAQTGTGTITGTVQDSAGSVFISAKVVLEPSGRQVATDDQGEFRIANLPVGEYTLTASYVGFNPYTTTVKVEAGQTANVTAALQVGSQADSVLVTAERLQGQAEAINVERMSANIVQVLPRTVIRSLPNKNIADAVGRLPSVSLERDEGEGKYVQIRGTEPRLSNVTINGVNVPSPEVTVRNIKLDVVPSDVVERIEVYKTLSADQDGDGIGGTVNLVTKTALEKPTYSLSGTAGYNPIQNGYWLGGFDGSIGQRFGPGGRLGLLLGGTWDRTNRGIDDLEPAPTFGTLANGQNVAYFSTADLRSYKYYRTRYGFELGTDYKITPTMSAYLKGLFADFHDFGETRVYTPNAGALTGASGSQITFDDTGSWQYRHYIRRPDQQVFSFLTGVRHELPSDVIVYQFAASRGHNIGGQDFPTTYFNGPSNVRFTQDLSNPYRPKFIAQDGTNGYDPTIYSVNESDFTYYHATQLNFQGDASLAHNYRIYSHPSTFSVGLKIRNSASTQNENDQLYGVPGIFFLSDVLGTYTNPTYYNRSFAINGLAFGPTSDYEKILKKLAANQSSLVLDEAGSITKSAAAFFNANERVTAGYLQDVVFIGKLRLQGGIRFEGTGTHFLTNQLTANVDSSGNPLPPTITPLREDTGYTNIMPSVQVQYQLQKDTNLRGSYGRGISRPNIGDLVPTTTTDPNTSPGSISKGNPNLQPTKANNYDILIEHYFQPLGVLQAGYFYKQLYDPIFLTATPVTIPFNGAPKDFILNQSINGPAGHIQGIEAQWEQRFSFLPGLLSGVGVSANYSYTTSQVTFPANFNGGRTDKPALQRQAPNNYNFNLTYDKARFSARFAISHNDANIYAYQWSAGTGPANDPILGLKGPTGDNYLYAHTQYDVQGSYRVYKGLQVVASGLNLSNEVFGFYYGSGIYPNQREYYRSTVSFGVRWALAGEQ
ncbi:MAG TPA: TonB-dependent receptor [Silvibacterium sp.]|nr:TonB-dependent receptor [Silvibacterium sp.]